MPKLLVVIAVLWIAVTGGSQAQTFQSASTQDNSQTEAPAAPRQADQDTAAWFGNAVGHILDSE